jgi:hypothetical protein
MMEGAKPATATTIIAKAVATKYHRPSQGPRAVSLWCVKVE